MKKKNTYLAFLMLILPNLINAQAFKLKHEVITNDGNILEVDVLASFTISGKLGSSNLVFSYNTDGLTNPQLISHNLTIPFYTFTLTKPASNKVSLNPILNITHSGDPIAVIGNWTTIARIRFDVVDASECSELQWLYNGGTTETIIFKDDQITQISADELMNLNSCPLPVELAYFEAQNNGNKAVQLDWETTTETNNAFFEIQRKQDGQRWQSIGKINGSGTTSEVQHYQFLDNRPYTGLSYYKLKQVDHDGNFEYSSIQSVEIERPKLLTIYPNPVENILTIELNTLENRITELSLINITGRLERTISIQGNEQIKHINVKDLPQGIYFIQTSDSTPNKVYQKFVKL